MVLHLTKVYPKKSVIKNGCFIQKNEMFFNEDHLQTQLKTLDSLISNNNDGPEIEQLIQEIKQSFDEFKKLNTIDNNFEQHIKEYYSQFERLLVVYQKSSSQQPNFFQSADILASQTISQATLLLKSISRQNSALEDANLNLRDVDLDIEYSNKLFLFSKRIHRVVQMILVIIIFIFFFLIIYRYCSN